MKHLREMWADGDAAVGVWLMNPSTVTAEAAARSGFDFVCADLQHGVLDDMALVGVVQAAILGGTRVVSRVAWNDPVHIGKALDAGCEGVIVPMVNGAEEAAAAVRSSRYAPNGWRSFGPLMAGMRVEGYAHTANDTIAVIPMIETAAALRHLDEILAVPGVDAVYVGPDDLGLSLGLPVGTRDEHPLFAEAMQSVLDGCRRHGVVPGTHATGGWAARRLEQGFQLLAAVSDVGAMQAGLADELHRARS